MGDDGKYRKVTGHSKAKADAKYFDDDERLGKYADDYALLKQTFEEDPELKKAFIDNYKNSWPLFFRIALTNSLILFSLSFGQMSRAFPPSATK